MRPLIRRPVTRRDEVNLQKASDSLRSILFRISRAVMGVVPGGRIRAFGAGQNKIGSILVVNLDRQPGRWRRVLRELGRFRTFDGMPLVSIAHRLAAVDARDGRAVAATADVDPSYLMEHQLFVQPDSRLKECFGVGQPIRMTRQEVAVARSHVEVWKRIVAGPDNHVLVIEDDVWFRSGAAASIDRGWHEALRRCADVGGPRLLYLSYGDAGGGTTRAEVCATLFRPLRGLWFLSGYVLSRAGAELLLKAMPVVGPVDMWMNYRFGELGALALLKPVIEQRSDTRSDNVYSILPFLARAGVVDVSVRPTRPRSGTTKHVIAWTARGDREGLAMAMSMLGLRVRVFDENEMSVDKHKLATIMQIFDAIVDAKFTSAALDAAIADESVCFLIEEGAVSVPSMSLGRLPERRIALLPLGVAEGSSWSSICMLLDLGEPAEAFPQGAPRSRRMFRDDRAFDVPRASVSPSLRSPNLDDSPWVLPASVGWGPRIVCERPQSQPGRCVLRAEMTSPDPSILSLVETFPGNQASFTADGVVYSEDGARLLLTANIGAGKPYRSGAIATIEDFEYGHFEALIKAASGPGVVTGFFLNRDSPRQEIDIELPGVDPQCMLVNVYFNPGDSGAAMAYGYRGSPWRVDLGFDATLDFHLYAIDWRSDCIAWSVDGRVVHERRSWDPTPIPHLPMRLHANLWTPRSQEFAGRIDARLLPTTANFKSISVWA